MKIILKDGSEKTINIVKMGAMKGWEIQRRFIEFAMSKDPAFRTEYTMEVLEFAKVQLGENEIPLSTSAVIDNHIQTWDNLKLIFEAVLRENGIDPDTHAEKEHYWAQAGAEMAAAFIEETVRLIGPLMNAKKE